MARNFSLPLFQLSMLLSLLLHKGSLLHGCLNCLFFTPSYWKVTLRIPTAQWPIGYTMEDWVVHHRLHSTSMWRITPSINPFKHHPFHDAPTPVLAYYFHAFASPFFLWRKFGAPSFSLGCTSPMNTVEKLQWTISKLILL